MESSAKLEYFQQHRDAEHFQSLLLLARGRLTILRLVAGSDAKALRAALIDIQQRVKSPAKVDPEKAPPIQQYDDLMCTFSIGAYKSRFGTCTSRDELKAVWSDVNPLMSRIRELLSSVKTALSDLANAEKSRRKCSKIGKDAQREVDQQKKKIANAELRMGFFERVAGSEHVKDIVSVACKDHVPLTECPQAPLLIRDVSWSKQVLKAISPFKAHYDAFKPIFNSSKAKRTSGHGSRALEDPDSMDSMVAQLVDSFLATSAYTELPKEDMNAAYANHFEKDPKKKREEIGSSRQLAECVRP